jgi:hypothetical protein
MRTARELPRGHPRQRALVHARHELRGDAALHPLRRLHEPLPGLSRGRRARLWLGLSRPHGGGAHPHPDRRRQGRAPAQRLHLLRPLRERVPGAHSPAQAHAPLARAGVRAPPDPATVRSA